MAYRKFNEEIFQLEEEVKQAEAELSESDSDSELLTDHQQRAESQSFPDRTSMSQPRSMPIEINPKAMAEKQEQKEQLQQHENDLLRKFVENWKSRYRANHH